MGFILLFGTSAAIGPAFGGALLLALLFCIPIGGGPALLAGGFFWCMYWVRCKIKSTKSMDIFLSLIFGVPAGVFGMMLISVLMNRGLPSFSRTFLDIYLVCGISGGLCGVLTDCWTDADEKAR